jgi:hypothetical protein
MLLVRFAFLLKSEKFEIASSPVIPVEKGVLVGSLQFKKRCRQKDFQRSAQILLHGARIDSGMSWNPRNGRDQRLGSFGSLRSFECITV